jgi:transposase
LVKTTPANLRDEIPAVEMVESLPRIKNPRGRPRKKPGELLGDRGYGFPWIIAAIVMKRIKSLLAPRGSPHGSGLGKRRYVIERTMAWMDNFRRLRLCYEKTGKRFQAFNELACCVICAGKFDAKT